MLPGRPLGRGEVRPMEQAALVIGVLCSVLSVALAFLHDWKVVVIRRDDRRAKDEGGDEKE